MGCRPVPSAAMRRVLIIGVVGLIALAGCGGTGDGGGVTARSGARPTTTVPASPQEVAFVAAAKADPIAATVGDTFDAEDVADRICRGALADIVNVRDHVEVARAAYTWRCPERMPEFAAEEQRRAAEAAAAAEQHRQAEEAARRRAVEEAARAEVGINSDEFAQIQNGMTYPEVERIVGSPGELTVSSELAGYTGAIYQWEGESGTGLGANAMVQLQNGRVIMKSQFGL